ncbi:hypothetical protein GAO09_16990 [Rhizobiales bacterium RZME27]|uniref:DUF2946 domain-containing protein n=1 Tax=Endobacterium cereale TaxID=2663029 RepID=A0A6A8AAK7_9HYPH|nr:hypothetical protein [Endobacterium cereale]MEB2846844.1 hypothetical protein [Endobacterium cereale]MQY47734.1 hypothetical protein [Endobacterium cereale]
MNRFAATLMAIACLLYAAMPVWATPMGTVAVPSMEMAAMVHDHDSHDMSAMVTDHANHSGKSAKPCPHGAQGCVTPFCAACLVILPDQAFQPLSRIAFSYPAPSPASELVPHAPALNLPPPRA